MISLQKSSIGKSVWTLIQPIIFAIVLFSYTNMANAYVGPQECNLCHEDLFYSFSKTKMGNILLNNPQNELQAHVCEACHGPGEGHLASWEESDELDLDKIISFKEHSHQTKAEQNKMCLQCHKDDHNRMSWVGSVHETQNVGCADCHKIMRKVSNDKQMKKRTEIETCFQCHPDKKAQFSKTSHMPVGEGKVRCTNCHNPHGGQGEPLLKRASINEVCYQCHADKRGPLLWEHAPVRENCANCHNPHGSNQPRLLKARVPWLCQQCHSSMLHSSEMYDGRSVAGGPRPIGRMLGKACLNCHSRIHGSNHPSGPRFQR